MQRHVNQDMSINIRWLENCSWTSPILRAMQVWILCCMYYKCCNQKKCPESGWEQFTLAHNRTVLWFDRVILRICCYRVNLRWIKYNCMLVLWYHTMWVFSLCFTVFILSQWPNPVPYALIFWGSNKDYPDSSRHLVYLIINGHRQCLRKTSADVFDESLNWSHMTINCRLMTVWKIGPKNLTAEKVLSISLSTMHHVCFYQNNDCLFQSLHIRCYSHRKT